MGMQEWLPQVQADYEECLSRLPPRSVGFLDRRPTSGEWVQHMSLIHVCKSL